MCFSYFRTMIPERTISKAEARDIIIDAQLPSYRDLNSLEIIRKLGYVQIDTLAVAERSHHHVFHSRNTSYKQSELTEMMKGKQIFEYWSHAASFLPIDDYRYSLIRKKEFAQGKSHWFKRDKKMSRYVLDRIKAEGSLQSKDFKDAKDISGAWYNWKPAKVALEQLFMEGKLMVSQRINFQKVYDLTERVLPSGVDTSMPSVREFCEYLIKGTLSAQGLATLSEIGYLRKGIKSDLEKTMKKLVREKEVIPVKIEGSDQLYYAIKTDVISNENNQVHILSPFDNIIIQRKRTLELFEFDYQLECYVPEHKRKFGYYCLPVLYKNRFIGKFDPKADRKTGVFTIKSFWFEADFVPDNAFAEALAQKLKDFITFCGCERLEIINPPTHSILEAVKRRVNS